MRGALAGRVIPLSALGLLNVRYGLPHVLGVALFAPAAVQRYFGMPVETLEYFDNPCRYDTTRATSELGALGLACPPLPSYVGRLVEFYRAHRDGVRRSAMV